MSFVTVAIAVSWGSGLLIVWMLAPRPQSGWSVGLQACIGLGLGLAISAGVFFFARAVLGQADWRVLLLDCILFVAIAMMSLVTSRSGPSGDVEVMPANGGVCLIGGAMLAALAAVVIVDTLSFRELIVARPHGNWDAWAMWNMKARWIFAGGSGWRLAFGDEMVGVRPDYPLLVPLTVARLWACLGDESTVMPRLNAAMFSGLTLAVVFFGVGRMSGVVNAAAAGLALAGSQIFVDEGSSQYADMPLSFFIASAIVLIASAGEARYGMNRLWALAGLAAAAAACTKNEGQLFFVACGVSTLIVGALRLGPRTALRSLVMAMVGASPLLALVLSTKLMFAWQNYLFEDRSVGEIMRLTVSSARWGQVGYWGRELIDGIVSPAILLLVFGMAVVAWVIRRRSAGERLVGHQIGAVCMLLMALGYLFIYLTTPEDIGWHMRTSFSRLVLHLWPGILFLVFSAAPRAGGHLTAQVAD